jgi:ribosomal protein S17E
MLDNDNAKRFLTDFKNYVVKESKSNLTRLKKSSSKKLYNSIKGTVKVSKNSMTVDFSMEDYGLFQDKGVSGKRKKYKTPYTYKSKMPPPKKLDKWIVRKGIAPRNEKGQLMTRKSLQFVIARGIYFNGIKPSLFFTKPFDKAFKRMPNELIEKYGLDVDNFLEHTLKEFKK